MRRILVCGLFLLIPFLAFSGGQQAFRSTPRDTGEIIPGVVIIKFKPGIAVTAGSLAKGTGVLGTSLARIGVQSLRRTFPAVQPPEPSAARAGRVDLSRIFYGALNAVADVRAAARRIGALPGVEYAEPKYMQRMLDNPNDPAFSANQLLYFNLMRAPAGWAIAKGSRNVIIGDVDAGTYWQHEDLQPNLWIDSTEDINHNGRFDLGPPPAGDEDGIDQDNDGFVDDVIGWNFANNSDNPRGLSTTPQSAAHGTATASQFGAVTDNGIGMAGSSWNCTLLPVCAASPRSDTGIEFGYEGIQFVSSHGASVINCSWGRLGNFSLFEHDVVLAATQAGSLIVAASGNDSVNVDLVQQFPSQFPEVLSVGATNSTNDAKAWFSNYGVTVSVFAPGTDIWSAFDGGGYGDGGSGTSFSTPMVTGLAGIIKAAHPAWSPRQIALQIHTTADSIDAVNQRFSGLLGHGRVNFFRALTESHAGIEIESSTLLTPGGRDYFIPGDTAVLTLIVKNILFRDAAGLQFSVTATDPALEPLVTTATVPNLAANTGASLPQFMFTVGSMSAPRQAVLTVRWVSNGNERDASAFRMFLFPAPPLWEVQAVPTPQSLFSVRAVNSSVVWASGGNGNATAPVVVRTVDGGAHWTGATGNLSGTDFYCINAIDQLHAWVGSSDGKIYATSDGGTSWVNQPYPGTQSPFIDGIWFFDANNGFALGDPPGAGNERFIVLKTTNGGQSWTHLAAEPVGITGEAGWNNSFWWNDPQHGWFGTNSARVWATTDGGATWISGTTPFNNSVGVSFKDNMNGVAISDGGTTAITSNGGVAWLPGGNTGASTLAAVAFVPGTDYVWTTDGTSPLRSTDAGKSWTSETTFPVGGTITHLSFVDTTHGWGVTSFGEVLFRRVDTTAVHPPPGPAVITSLEQNYPNPFIPGARNPFTYITYTVGEPGNVSITLYDLLGRKVATLLDGARAAGTDQVRFSGSGLASGVYFYRMEAPNFSRTMKMVLLH